MTFLSNSPCCIQLTSIFCIDIWRAGVHLIQLVLCYTCTRIFSLENPSGINDYNPVSNHSGHNVSMDFLPNSLLSMYFWLSGSQVSVMVTVNICSAKIQGTQRSYKHTNNVNRSFYKGELLKIMTNFSIKTYIIGSQTNRLCYEKLLMSTPNK